MTVYVRCWKCGKVERQTLSADEQWTPVECCKGAWHHIVAWMVYE